MKNTVKVFHELLTADTPHQIRIMETYDIINIRNGTIVQVNGKPMVVVKHMNYEGCLLGKFLRTIWVVSQSNFIPCDKNPNFIGYFIDTNTFNKKYINWVKKDGTEKGDYIIKEELKKTGQWPFDD